MSKQLIFHLFLTAVRGFLDIDELKSVNYGVDIVSTPVLQGKDVQPGSMTLTSKFGQLYQCTYPVIADREREKEEEDEAMERGIPELLKTMEMGPCLIHTKGWWNYEFCYGKEIRQYHSEGNKVVGIVTSLGKFETDYDWSSKNTSHRHHLVKYHSQQYVNGSSCDLTGKLRRAEVRFMCEAGSGDYIQRIDEPETCVYTIYVHTMKICHHPYLKPAKPQRAVPITCNPLLTEAQYHQYEKNQQQTLELSSSDSTLPGSTADAAEQAKQGTNEALEKLFVDSLTKGLQKAFSEGQEEVEVNNIKISHQKSGDLDSLLKEAFKEKEKTAPKSKLESQDIEPSDDGKTSENDVTEQTQSASLSHKDTDTQPDSMFRESFINVKKQKDEDGEGENEKEDSADTEDEDQDLIKEFQDGLDDIAPDEQHKARLAKYKDNIESVMHSQFSDIVNEAQQEMQQEGLDADVDKNVAFQQLAQTLSKLLSRMDRAQKDISVADDALKELSAEGEEDEEDSLFKTKKHTKVPSTATSYKEAMFRKTTRKSNLPTKSVNKDQYKKQGISESPAKVNSADADSDNIVLDNRVRVRITRPKGPIRTNTQNEDGSTQAMSKLPGSRRELDLPDSKKAKLAETVKNKLKEAGLNTHGRKIEVKIITAGYYDNDDESLHVLSDEDGSSFNKMLFAVIGANDEEVKEQQRQQQMEDSYSFVYGQHSSSSSKKKEADAIMP